MFVGGPVFLGGSVFLGNDTGVVCRSEQAKGMIGLIFPPSLAFFLSSILFMAFTRSKKSSAAIISAMRKYRYVALDLDGTTLNASHQLSQYTIQTIQELNSKGLQFLIATGRSSNSILSILQQISFPKQQLIPSICYNGACGIQISTTTTTSSSSSSPIYSIKSFVFQSFLSMESTDKLLSYAISKGLCAQYYVPDDGAVYASPQSNQHSILLERYAKLTGKKQYLVSDYEYPKSISPPAKILLLVEESEVDILLEEVQQVFGREFHIVRGSPSPFFIEFLSPGTNKGNGLRLLCDTMKIPLDNLISFGDGENDEEFLRYAGIGIAMKNARPLAKSAANIVLDWTNDDDGVARQLEKMAKDGWLDLDD